MWPETFFVEPILTPEIFDTRRLFQVLESGVLKDTPREAAAALPTLLPFF